MMDGIMESPITTTHTPTVDSIDGSSITSNGHTKEETTTDNNNITEDTTPITKVIPKSNKKKSKRPIQIVKKSPVPIDYKQWHTEWPINVYTHPVNGRYLVATKDVEEQTVILRDLPYTWAVDHATCESVCQHCFSEVPLDQQIVPSDFYMCEGCQRVGYCSTNCKYIDYSQHRFECQIFKELDTEEYSPFLMSEIKLLVRTLSRKWLEESICQTAGIMPTTLPIQVNQQSNTANGDTTSTTTTTTATTTDESESNNTNNNNNNNNNNNTNNVIKNPIINSYGQYKNPTSLIPQDNGLRYNDYAELVSNVENYNEQLKESLSYWICKYIVKLSAKLGRVENEFDLLNILLRNRCNAFYIQGRPRDGTPGDSRGCGVYVRNSFFNHSCDPNVNYWVVNNTLEVECTLLKNVKEGDELTISYIDTTSPLDKRREKLLEGYLFNCLCTKCKSDELLPLSQTGTISTDDNNSDIDENGAAIIKNDEDIQDDLDEDINGNNLQKSDNDDDENDDNEDSDKDEKFGEPEESD